MSLAELINKIEELKSSNVSSVIQKRIEEFERIGRSSIKEIFKELCFCILTANYNARGGVKIQEATGDGFLILGYDQLAKKLKELGHRFPSTRAKYIVEARKKIGEIDKILNSELTEKEKREWLVKNIKGLGYKEASHFLRNIGYKNLAIIDFHIVDVLVRHGLIEKPKTLTKRKYLEIEDVLKKIADRVGLSLAELDLYLWYMETGVVLK
ncbi:MAG: N-glycosylase/DNA lyase [Candidatus Aenigmarchaeota archaeon]|nr:N-glycosylase/DNA lyase [Candidatus Aenigmarchaeota archaeon]